jgi:hypothetical protein
MFSFSDEKFNMEVVVVEDVMSITSLNKYA